MSAENIHNLNLNQRGVGWLTLSFSSYGLSNDCRHCDVLIRDVPLYYSMGECRKLVTDSTIEFQFGYVSSNAPI